VKIVVNGQEYDSWDQVPEEIRALMGGTLPDADHNGVPDLLEGGPIPTAGMTVQSTAIDVDGVTYQSLADLPPQARAALEAAGLTGAPGAPATAPAPLPPAAPAPATGQVLLNGEPVGANGSAKRRHWWQRR
jgi:hypothetical protein